MPTDLQKLAKVMMAIKKQHPTGGGRYSTIVENPFESGYRPLVKPKRVERTGAHKPGRISATTGSR